MDYQNTLTYLYESVPMFQQIGGKAYKPGLDTTHRLDEYFGHPHQEFKTIHIAGTNGKGSCSHTIASVLQSAGYRVGLFTSPHLLDFRERIRINGEMIPREYVVRFVEEHRPFFEPLHPSFFELTTLMAFRYFADCHIDVAVVEVGMGGRLDCTNIIRPDLCVVTSISLDHTQYLGDTLEKIAAEKAGIIKEGIPVVIGAMPATVGEIFRQKAAEMNAPFHIAATEEDIQKSTSSIVLTDDHRTTLSVQSPRLPLGVRYELTGNYQVKNIHTIIKALDVLRTLDYRISDNDLRYGLLNVCRTTGLTGRWQQLQDNPTLICDTGHNPEAFESMVTQLRELRRYVHPHIHIVLGMVKDKDVRSVLHLLPRNEEGYSYYFTRAGIERALPEDALLRLAAEEGLQGDAYPTVSQAVEAAQKKCLPEEMIYVGGSNFIVADLLAGRDTLNLH